MSGGAIDGYSEWRVEDWARDIRRINPLMADFVLDFNKVLHACDYELAGDYGEGRANEEWDGFRGRWMSEDGYRRCVTMAIWGQIALIDRSLVPEDVLAELRELERERW